MDKEKLIAAVVGILLGVGGAALGFPSLKQDVCQGVQQNPVAQPVAPAAQ